MTNATPVQQAVLDALGEQRFSVSTLAFHMGLSYGTVHSRLVALWRKVLVDRGFQDSELVWWGIGDDFGGRTFTDGLGD